MSDGRVSEEDARDALRHLAGEFDWVTVTDDEGEDDE